MVIVCVCNQVQAINDVVGSALGGAKLKLHLRGADHRMTLQEGPGYLRDSEQSRCESIMHGADPSLSE